MHTAVKLLDTARAPIDATRTVAADPPVPGAYLTPVRMGYGLAPAHHGEVVQGVFYSSDGTLDHGLVTMPCPLFRARAWFRPLRSGPVTVEPSDRARARMAARLTLDALGRTGWGGALRIESDVPLRWGCGSSTADVLAAIRAVADAFETAVSPHWIARLSVASEAASDSVMYGPERAVLFAQRRGSLLCDLGGPLPPVRVLGFNTEGGHGVETLMLPPCEYSTWEIEAFRSMLGLLRRAVEHQDSCLLGRVATASTIVMQRHRPKRGMSELLRVAAHVGALGVQVAHSGTVVGFLFPPGDVAAGGVDRARTALGRLGVHQSWVFSTDSSPPLACVS